VAPEIAPRQDLRDVVTVADDEDDVTDLTPPRLVHQAHDARRRSPDEQQPTMRSDAMHTSHGVEHIVVAAPGTDADLCDQHVTGLEAELTTDSAPIDVGMKATEVGARVDDLDLL